MCLKIRTQLTMERALAHTRAHSRADRGGEAVVRGVGDCGEIGLMTGGSLHTYTCAHSTLGLALTFDKIFTPILIAHKCQG